MRLLCVIKRLVYTEGTNMTSYNSKKGSNFLVLNKDIDDSSSEEEYTGNTRSIIEDI